MQLTERHVGSATVVDVAGTMAADEGAVLKDAIVRLLDRGDREIVLDLAELTYVDSAALGNLVASQIRASRFGTTLKLANAGKRLQDLLVLTRLLTVFDSHDTVQDAVDSYRAGRPSGS